MNTTITTKSEQGGNPDQQNHNPQLHRQNFKTQTQNSTQFFFTNYVETKLYITTPNSPCNQVIACGSSSQQPYIT